MKKPRVRKASRAGRIADYLALTYPPIPMLVGAAISFGAVYFLIEALARHARLEYTWRALGAVVTCYAMSLLFRVYDELKDVETDRRLGAAGDPKYAERPIVLGLVDEGDLGALRWVVSLLAFVASLLSGAVLFAAFAVLYLVMWMSSRWYFWPKMRDKLLVAFVTHNPMTLLLQAYGALAYVEDFGMGALSGWRLSIVLLAQQGIASAWETARKIRAPEEESDYVTYSRVFGPRRAALIPMTAIAFSATSLVWMSALAELSVVYLAAVGISAVVVLGVIARFCIAPSARTSKLQPFVEGFILVVSVGGFVAVLTRWGIEVRPIR